MTIPRLLSLKEYHEKWPPVHKLVAQYIGYKPPEKRKAEEDAEEFIAAALSMNQGVGF